MIWCLCPGGIATSLCQDTRRVCKHYCLEALDLTHTKGTLESESILDKQAVLRYVQKKVFLEFFRPQAQQRPTATSLMINTSAVTSQKIR